MQLYRTILRTVLDIIEYLKPLMAIGMTIFSIFKSSPEFQKIIKNARAYSRYAYRVVKKLSELLPKRESEKQPKSGQKTCFKI